MIVAPNIKSVPLQIGPGAVDTSQQVANMEDITIDLVLWKRSDFALSWWHLQRVKSLCFFLFPFTNFDNTNVKGTYLKTIESFVIFTTKLFIIIFFISFRNICHNVNQLHSLGSSDNKYNLVF